MGRTLFICAVLAASLPLHMACAADTDSDTDDIVILSVKPRSPDVKPIAAPVSAQAQDIAAGPTDAKVQPVRAGTEVSARR